MSFTFNRELVSALVERNGHVTQRIAQSMLAEIDRLNDNMKHLHNAHSAEVAAYFNTFMDRLIEVAQKNANKSVPLTFLLAARADPVAFYERKL